MMMVLIAGLILAWLVNVYLLATLPRRIAAQIRLERSDTKAVRAEAGGAPEGPLRSEEEDEPTADDATQVFTTPKGDKGR